MVFWPALIGLVLTLAGALVAARGVIISPVQASALASTDWDENTNLRDALLKQSKLAKWGLLLVALGTALQVASLVIARVQG